MGPVITPDALAQAARNLEAPNIERKESSHEPPVQQRGVVRDLPFEDRLSIAWPQTMDRDEAAFRSLTSLSR